MAEGDADDFAGLEVGFDIPALPGMDVAAVQTPCLLLDLDALERNIRKMGDYARAHGMRHRAHGKMHKSVDVAKLQMTLGGAAGICCQKVSEAEVFARGGVSDVFVTNQVRDPAKIDRLVGLPALGAEVSVLVDDLANVHELDEAAGRRGATLNCLVEIDCGAGRCGVTSSDAVVTIARAIEAAGNLSFAGVQAYQGGAQHDEAFADRKAKIDVAITMAKDAVAALSLAGVRAELVSGGGTGTFALETHSGVYNELQCGSYAFMDADYGQILGEDGERLDQGAWENAFFLLTQVMSHAKPDFAVCDAGAKALSFDGGPPVVHGADDLRYAECSDDHGVIADPAGRLKVGDKLRLVPGHCDPTVNLHDWYVCARGDRVETLWPVSARGKLF